MLATANFAVIFKSETFWVAAQSIVSFVGLWILYKYTKYTKRMMELQLETRRAEISPVFTLSSISGSAVALPAPDFVDANAPPDRNIHISLRNVGKGPALRVRGWHGPVAPTFELKSARMITRRSSDKDGISASFDVLANEPADMVFQNAETNQYWLCVLECEDTGGNKHQFQLLRLPRAAAIDPWLMVHPWSTV